MELVNSMGCPARLHTGFVAEGEKLCWVLARMTWRLDRETGELFPSERIWPLFNQPLETDKGWFPPDGSPLRHGCELVVVGDACSREPVRSMEVSVTAGSFVSRLAVHGDRVWEELGDDLVPSEPEPFTEMPLDWTRAHGGASELEGLLAPHPLNPRGLGYYTSLEQARGNALANLEHPDHPVDTWDDVPLPVAWAPVGRALPWYVCAWAQGHGTDDPLPAGEFPAQVDSGELLELAQSWNDGAAIPCMVAPGLEPRDPVRLDLGATRVEFSAPRTRLELRARLEDAVQGGAGEAWTHVEPMRLAGLWMMLPIDLVVVTYYGRFVYPYRQRQRRRVALCAATETP